MHIAFLRHDAQLTAFMITNPAKLHSTYCEASADDNKAASNTDDQYVPYILPTEFALEDSLKAHSISLNSAALD